MYMQIAREIGRQVKTIRLKKGMSRAQLARRSGLSDRIVGLVEAGRANPTLETLIKLGQALRCPLKCSF